MEIEILHPERLREWSCELDLPEGSVEAFVGVAKTITENPDLLRIFTEFHDKTALRGEWHKDWSPLPMDPLVTQILGKDDTLFYLLGYLAAYPYTKREYLRRGIDLKIMYDTLWDIQHWFNYDSNIRGYWFFDHFPWIWRHFTVDLFRLGRLQFMLQAFSGRVTAFKNKENGEYVLLADPETRLRADGYAEGAGGSPSGEEGWLPVFETTEEGWCGHIVSPYGNVMRDATLLHKDEWELYLQNGDTILDLHIPRAANLNEEDCRESFRQAYEFFPKYFPDRPFKGVYCHTWMFTPQLQAMLPPHSNIVRFQREFYLYPYAGSVNFLWSFVFGDHVTDRKTAPRDSSLRCRVLDWLAEGNEVFDLPGIMFHEPDAWGKQPYMGNWDREK